MPFFIEKLGLIAGLAGIALGVFVLLFREVIRLRVFAPLNGKQSYIIIFTFLILVWTISIFAIIKYVPVPVPSNTVTVLVHGIGGSDDLLLQNRGIVTLQYGDAVVKKEINGDGEATFKQVSSIFFTQEPKVKIFFTDPQGEPYKAHNPDSLYHLVPNQAIPLLVELRGINEISGVVTNSVTLQPEDSVRVSISVNTFTYTNPFGEFTIPIPRDKQKKFQTIQLNKKGFKFRQLSDIAPQTGAPLPIKIDPL